MGLEFTSFYEKFIIIGDVSVLRHYLYMKIKYAFFSQRNMMMRIFFSGQVAEICEPFPING